MLEAQANLHMIFLEDAIALSKHPYDGWRHIQDAYPTYKGSLCPMTADDVIVYFEGDDGDNDERWPFSRQTIHEFARSDAVTITSD